MVIRRTLKTTDIQKQTGWSLIKIRKLIADGKLKAINTSCGSRPYWEIPVEAFEAFLNGESQGQSPKATKAKRSGRIDASVPKVFG